MIKSISVSFRFLAFWFLGTPGFKQGELQLPKTKNIVASFLDMTLIGRAQTFVKNIWHSMYNLILLDNSNHLNLNLIFIKHKLHVLFSSFLPSFNGKALSSMYFGNFQSSSSNRLTIFCNISTKRTCSPVTHSLGILGTFLKF